MWKLQRDIQEIIKAIQAFTYDDYLHTYAPTNEPGDPRAHGRKWDLLCEMNEAFRTYAPAKWTQAATERALTAIMNQIQIKNSEGNEWEPNAIKQLLKRGPDPNLTFTIRLTRPNVKPWYTRPE